MKPIDIEERLNDHADGLLDAEQLRELEAWLEEHPEDRDRLEQIRALKHAAGALERRADPPRDLWPGIRSEIERQAASPGRTTPADPQLEKPVPFAAPRRMTRLPWWGALAASVVVGLGGVWLALQLRPGGGDAGDATPPGVATNLPGRAEQSAAPGETDGSRGTRSAVAPAGSTPLADTPGVALAGAVGRGRMDADLAVAEEEFARASEQLMSALQARRSQIDPQTLEFIESNLQVINKAIEEVRSALEVEPGNPARGHALAALYKQRMQLLWMASSLTTEL